MNLIDEALRFLGPGVIEKASALVGEPPASTRRGLTVAVPTVVAGLAEETAPLHTARRVLRAVSEAGLEGAPAGVLDRLQAASGEELVALGKTLLGEVFGGRLGSITAAAADAAEVAPSSMAQILGLAAPLVFGALGSAVHERHLDAPGLASLLGTQRNLAASALPASVLAVLAPVPTTSATRDERVREAPRMARPAPPAPRFQHLWPLLLLIPVAILAGVLVRRPSVPVTREPWVPRARLGVGVAPPVTPEPLSPGPALVPGGVIGREMAQYLARPGGETSRRFVFDNLNFELATANLVPEAAATLDDVAAALKAYPRASVVVEGHTDATGVPADNERLSLERAEAVKRALVTRGVSADRIQTEGLGQDRPLAPNDTEAGRAKNRRTEILVTPG